MKFPRLSGWLVITAILLACIFVLAPQQLPVSLYKLSLVSMAAVAGYWIDRELFPYARPDTLIDYQAVDDIDSLTAEAFHGSTPIEAIPDPALNLVFGMAMLRRAIIVGSVMLAIGLGA